MKKRIKHSPKFIKTRIYKNIYCIIFNLIGKKLANIRHNVGKKLASIRHNIGIKLANIRHNIGKKLANIRHILYFGRDSENILLIKISTLK